MAKKINLTQAKRLVDELGLVEEYSREIKAEVDARKTFLHPFVGQTLVGDEFESSVYERTSRNLNIKKLMKKFGLTEKQLKSCYDTGETSTIVTIKRIGEKKKATRATLIKNAKKKVAS